MSSESQQYLKKITETLNIPIQNIVDTYKCFLLHDNGGMWVDTTTMFVRDLNWIETIDNDKRVYNKIRDDP
jgi:mannosyltransferase OCH1-like enzyme